MMHYSGIINTAEILYRKNRIGLWFSAVGIGGNLMKYSVMYLRRYSSSAVLATDSSAGLFFQ